MSGLILSLGKTYLFSVILMLLIWGIYLLTGNPGVVDVGWVLGIYACSLLYLFKFNQTPLNNYHYLALFLVTIWAIRLGGFLFITRVMPGHIDPRYENLKNSLASSESLNYLMNFQLQAFLLIFVASCFYFIANSKLEPGTYLYLGALVVIIGIIGESLADYQLYNFKQSGSVGICDSGLWKYSRHPNYFFEVVTWTGFAIMAIQNGYNLLAFVSPIWLFGIMYYFTIPITEEHIIDKKPEAYKEYMKETSKFLPLPTKIPG
jgi:steroid 5-alpha reductase family enzyme